MPGGIFKNAAARVLRLERRLMSTGEITRVALRRGLLQCSGKTPEATMASALYTDVKRKEKNSVFTRPGEGLFGMREWEAEGFDPPRPGDARGGGGADGSPAGHRRPRAQTQRQSAKAKREREEREERERVKAAREAAAAARATAAAAARGERRGGKVKPEPRDAMGEGRAGGSAERGEASEGEDSLGKRKERDESILLLLSAADELDVDKNREPSVHNTYNGPMPGSKASPSSEQPSPISKLREALGKHMAQAATPSTPSSDEALIASGRIGAGMRLLGGTPTTFALGSGGPAGGMPLAAGGGAAAAGKAVASNLATMQAIEAQIGALEGSIGGSPHVGRAWLDLTKLYHQHGLFERAEATLLRSFLIFQRCQGQGPASDSCRLAYGNLLATIQSSKAHRRALRARLHGPEHPAGAPGAAPETPSGGAAAAGTPGQPIACLSPVQKGHGLAPKVA